MEITYEISELGKQELGKILIFPANTCQPHFHAKAEILLINKDGFTVNINGVTQTLKKGEVCVSGSYDVHSYVAGEGEATCITISAEYLNKYSLFVKGTVISEHVIGDKKLYEELTYLTKMYLSYGEGGSPLISEGWANVVMGLLVKRLRFIPMGEAGNVETFRSVLMYINEHFDEDITLQSLARKFGYSPYHFSRIFNSYVTVGLKKYVNSVRLDFAIEKLKNGAGVMEAAYESGFNSIRSFYREFTGTYGASPVKYFKDKSAENAKPYLT